VADLLGTIRKLVEPALNRVKVLAQRGVVRSSQDAPKAATLEIAVLAGETLREVERFAHFGLTSRPPTGAEVVVLCLGGNRDHPLVVADEDRRARPAGTLAEGETCIYATGGARITLRADGSIEVEASGDLTVTGKLSVTGDVEATGNVKDAAGTLAALRNAYNVHTHSDPQGGSTGPPVPTV
jgi:phage gp45-like